MRIVVTGASGFIGSAAAGRLSRYHDVVRCVRQATGRGQEIVLNLSHPQFDAAEWLGVDAVVHAGGLVGNSTDIPEAEYSAINVQGTRAIYENALSRGITRVILISTGAVYAPCSKPLDEESATGPEDAYGRSKLTAEDVAAGYVSSIETVVLRLFFPYGFGQRAQRLVPQLVARITRGEPIATARGTGTTLALCHVRDVVECISMVLERWRPATVNVGGNDVVTIRELAERIGFRVKRSPEWMDSLEGEARTIVPATRLAEEIFGFRSRVALDEGLDEVCRVV